MFTHPDHLGRLARDHHRQLPTYASQRQLRHGHGRPATRTPDAARIRRRLAAATAIVLAGIAVAGCGSPTGSPAAPAAGSTCYQWSGVGDLYGVTLPLREMASDEEDGSGQGNDALAVVAAAEPLDGIWEELPNPYAEEVQNEVLAVASSPSAATPEQLVDAAADAEDLASQIGQLCLSSPS
jgi:hypothetical protein